MLWISKTWYFFHSYSKTKCNQYFNDEVSNMGQYELFKLQKEYDIEEGLKKKLLRIKNSNHRSSFPEISMVTMTWNTRRYRPRLLLAFQLLSSLYTLGINQHSNYIYSRIQLYSIPNMLLTNHILPYQLRCPSLQFRWVHRRLWNECWWHSNNGNCSN